MKKITIFLSFILVIMIYSCSKDKKISANDPAFSQFKVGSYWVYQRFNIDSAGIATATNVYDSCYVVKDTIINNRTYVKTYRPNHFILTDKYLCTRDSLQYVVASNGRILFSAQDFETVFSDHFSINTNSDTLFHVVKKMTGKDLSFTTPAGTFKTSDCLETYTMYPGFDNAGSPRYKHNRYAENIGIVTETLPINTENPNSVERRLARYHIVL